MSEEKNKIIDNKGRLFGKINIVDLLIVLVIVCGVLFVGLKYVLPKNDVVPTQSAILVIRGDTKNYVAEQLQKGASVWDASGNVELGVLDSWEISDYVEPIASERLKQTVEYINPDLCFVDLTIKSNGVVGEHGLTIGDTLYGCGHTMVIYSGQCKIFVTVKSITAE